MGTNVSVGVASVNTRAAGYKQTFTKNLTSGASTGAVTTATATVAPVLVNSVTVRANAVPSTDLTSIAVTAGTASVTLISAVEGIRANLVAIGNQVVSPSGAGPFYLNTGETIVTTFTGTGATALNLQVIVECSAVTDGGYLV